MEHYQVKFTTPDGVVYYGIVHYGTKPKRGMIKVDDAVLYQRYEVPEDKLVDLPTEFGGEYDKFVDDARDKAIALSDGLPDGLVVGKLFSLGVADGLAWYVVTKVGKQNVTIEWRGFCGDRYTDEVLGWGGTFPRRIIEPIVKRNEAVRKIFGGKGL